MNKRLEENIKELEEVILDHKKNINALKESCKNIDTLIDIAECALNVNEKIATTNGIDAKVNEIIKNTNIEKCNCLKALKDENVNHMNKLKALMLTAVEELRKEKEEYRKIQEIPKPEAPKTEYEYIQDLINDVSDVVYNEFKVMTWSASVSVDNFHKPLQYKRYVIKYNIYERSMIKYNIYERSMALMDNYWDIDPLSTKAFEQSFLYDLIKTLIEKLKDAGFTVHPYVDEHYSLTCGDTHIIEIWR